MMIHGGTGYIAYIYVEAVKEKMTGRVTRDVATATASGRNGSAKDRLSRAGQRDN